MERKVSNRLDSKQLLAAAEECFRLKRYNDASLLIEDCSRSVDVETTIGVCILNGHLAEERGDSSSALQFYRVAIEHLGDLIGNRSKKIGTYLNLALVLEKVGHIFLSQRDYHRALENFEHQLIIANSFIDEPSGIVDCMRIRSRAKVNMGDVWAERSILAICLKLYIASLQIDTEVLGMTGRVPDSLRDVSISQERIAKVYHSLGRSTSASSMYEMCLEIRLEILALTGNRPDSLLDLAQCYGNIAVFKGELGKIECLRAFELFAELAKDYPSVDQFAEGMAKTRVLAATFNWNLPASD